MLGTFRKGAGGILGKALLGLLIASFALWGIGDVFRGGGGQVLATVGEREITMQELDNIIARTQEQNPSITPDMAKSLPVRLQFLNQLVNTEVIYAEGAALGLDFSDELVMQRIANDPLFQTADGEFSVEQFRFILQQSGMSEMVFLRRYEKDIHLDLLQNIIGGAMRAPDAMVDVYYHIQNEQREGKLILLNERDIQKPAAADEAALQAIYEESAAQFTLPTFYQMRYVSFDEETVSAAQPIEISDEELRQRYDDNLALYETPEQRKVLQVIFDDEESAQKATTDLQGGASLQEVAANYRTLSREPTDMGNIAFTDLPERAASKVFSLDEGATTKPISSDFGWTIYQVEQILPPGTRPFDEVKEIIKEGVMAEKASERLVLISQQIDDAIAGGASLEEALKSSKFDTVTIESLGPISPDYLNEAEERVALSELESRVLEMALTLDKGDISPISLMPNDKRYYMVELQEVIPSRVKAFDSVKQELNDIYLERETHKALQQHASEVVSLLQQAETPMLAAQQAGYSLHSSGSLLRTDTILKAPSQKEGLNVGSSLVEELFTLRPYEVTGAHSVAEGNVAIAILETITPAEPPTAEEREALKTSLTLQLQQEVLQSYLAYLREKHQVSIDFDQLVAAQGS